MNGKNLSALRGQEGNDPRITARAKKTESGDVITEYDVDGRTYHDVDDLEAALRGEHL